MSNILFVDAANDKPYSFRELSARIKVQLRRYSSHTSLNLIRYPPLSLVLKQYKGFYNEEDLHTFHTKQEYSK